MLEPKFFICNHCGNIIMKVRDSGVPVVCCGEKMAELVAKTADSATEKHVPVVEIKGSDVKITVGSTLHPMTEEHYIQWIYLQTEKGVQFYKLKPGDQPIGYFKLTDGDKVIAAYEYCNLHGLWKAEL